MKKIFKVSFFSFIGTSLEMYDFVIYGILSPILAKVFFPMVDPRASYLIILATFASGFMMRPIGAIIFGHVGDCYGRRLALVGSILTTAFATFLMGIMPSYDEIGLTASIMIVFCRLLQGIGVGGEYNGASVFLIEHFKDNKQKGLAGSLIAASGSIGALLAVSMNFFIQMLPFSNSWRIPFLLGAALGIVGIYMRLYFEESPEYKAVDSKAVFPLKDVVKVHFASLIRAIGVGSFQGALAYTIFVYFSLYLKTTQNFTSSQVFLSNYLSLIAFCCFVPLCGFLSDKSDNLTFMKIGAVSIFLGAYPIFLFIGYANLSLGLFCIFFFSVIAALFIGPANAYLNQLFPVKMRYSGIAFGYCVGSSLFGGTMPLICEYFIQQTGDKLIPAYYLMLTAIIGFASVLKIRRKEFQLKEGIIPT